LPGQQGLDGTQQINRLILMYLVVSMISVLLLVVALVDIITKQDSQVQHLPKLVWVLLVVFLPLIGSVLWFAIGREHGTSSSRGSFGDPRRWKVPTQTPTMPRVDPAAHRITTTEQELADLDREIEFYEKQARLKRLQADSGAE
jgi:hypothetical protein